MKKVFRLLTISCAVLAAGCGPEGARRPAVPEGTPVVLISIDTLRADRLPAYGYGGVATPAIDELRRDSILFERAYSHVPLTLPSHLSLFTGLLPPEHGVRDNVGYAVDTEKTPFLPVALQRAGYATGAAVSAFVLRASTGMSTGFDFYEDAIDPSDQSALGAVQRPGGETLEKALPWLRSVADGPFFFFLHLFEPHTPYKAPEPFISRYGDAYDAEIAAADKVVGDLVTELRRLEAYDRSLIVLLSDHGEGLWDHGEPEHGVLLYTSTLQVPLLIKLPQARLGGSGEELPVQLADVFPTLRDLLGLEVLRELPGKNLLELDGDAPEPRQIYSETYYPRIHYGWSDLASLIAGRHQYIAGPDPELYDLLADPSQKRNVLRQERRIGAGLRDSLSGYDRSLTPPSEVDEETLRGLVALGYVGTTATTGDGPLPDPKAQIHTLVADFVAESIADSRRAVAAAPESAEARRGLGVALTQAGETEEAVEQYREAVRLEPERALHHYSLALVLDSAEALPHFARAVEIEPGYRPFRATLAARLATAERYEEAREHFDFLLAADPEDHEARLGGARVRVELGALEEATADARAILGASSALPRARAGAHHVLGAVLARGESKDEARRHLKEAVGLDPDLVDAHFLLASLAGQARLFDEAAAHFARVVELDPSRVSARLAEATALALGGREGQALERLAEGRETLPQEPAVAHALARLLVTASDPALRDGARALDLAQALFEFQQSFEHAETLAMALAEVGRFDEAVRLQRSLVEQVPPDAPAELAGRLRENLARYERGAPAPR